MRSNELYLVDILEAADAIERFIAGFQLDDFVKDEKCQSAVLQKFTTIGEAAARLPSDLRDRYPDIEWRKIVGLRNLLVHAYFSVKLSIIYATATKDVPQLRRKIAQILKQEFGKEI